ncbi:hypothetical protein OIU85_005675 [Salix viminalis]|uniref:Zeta toxin domain-containing protein n=1 Tax=Salix viminalis TaxID=40686 RepID=A0A9Q0PJA5_SALVM|nr:hypothetical protein OIU85_005675 [Salix viminalis]
MQLDNDNGHGKVIFTRVLATSLLGFFIAAAATQYYRRKSKARLDQHIIPVLMRTESGRSGNLEAFSDYVARQMGFADANECPRLCSLAYDYLKRSEGCENNIFDFFANQPEVESLYVKLIEELERCILTYFAFHWSKASLFISQVMDVESVKKPKLKGHCHGSHKFVNYLKKQRFERVTKNLKVTRAFSTLVEELKAIRRGETHCTEVMVPVALSERSPVLLLMGGGMGAGKSTVTKDILKEPFWSGAKAKAVVVEADAFKESDVIYRALSSMGHHDDMLPTSELVHKLHPVLTALNEGRDVIMDGTLSWEPFVEQTIAMARSVHKCRYRMGLGYRKAEDGTVTENYWEKVEEEEDGQRSDNEKRALADRKPYRIELVGVVCDPYLAVVRGIRRAITTRRAVRVNSQLTSHKRFASAFESYCKLVDNARLYCTNSVGAPPSLIAWKDGDHNLLIDPERYRCFDKCMQSEG